MRKSEWWQQLPSVAKAPDQLFQQLKETYLKGEFSKAMWMANRYRKRFKGIRSTAESYFMQGRIFKVIGDQILARIYLTNSTKRDPSFAPAFVELADISIAAGQFARAREELENAEKGEFPDGEFEPKKEYLKGLVHLNAKEYFLASNSLTYALWFGDALPNQLRNPVTETRAQLRYEEGYRIILPAALQYDSNPLWLTSLSDAPAQVKELGTVRVLSGIIAESDPFRFTSEPGRHHGYEASFFSLNHLTGGYSFLDTQILNASYKYAQRFLEPLGGFLNYVIAEPNLQITSQKTGVAALAFSIRLIGAGTQFEPFLRIRPGNLVERSGGLKFGTKELELFQGKSTAANAFAEVAYERALSQFYASGNNIQLHSGIDWNFAFNPGLSLSSSLPSVTLSRND